ncbi:hypothetical protein ABVF54_14230 [Enterococcus mundtii]|uniref:hypothetical protein n=1 Tax=Enterococcus mundtii TaxID=53346 RepID=UPI00336A6232
MNQKKIKDILSSNDVQDAEKLAKALEEILKQASEDRDFVEGISKRQGEDSDINNMF